MNMRLATVVLLMLAAALPAAAAPFESVERIGQTALAALDLGQGGRATVDPNLRLARCAGPLTTEVMGAATVRVGCADPGWQVFVPVVAANTRSVLVLARAVQAGQTLAAEDLHSQPRQTAGAAQALLVTPEQAIGRVARRHLQAGSLLSHSDLHAQQLVRRGQNVELLTRRGSVEIRVAARALRDGALGDSVAVENLSTRRTVTGTVQADGTVMVR